MHQCPRATTTAANHDQLIEQRHGRQSSRARVPNGILYEWITCSTTIAASRWSIELRIVDFFQGSSDYVTHHQADLYLYHHPIGQVGWLR